MMLRQFLQFGVIGVLGFVWDTATVYATAPVIGLYGAGVVAYVVACSINWVLNRVWTYRHLAHGAMHRQWMMFLAANAVGFVINRGTYFSLIASVPVCHDKPVLAVAAGAVAGMFINFFLSRRLVFRA
jgi:putative flippase GtrA